MADLSLNERLQPALLDRLIDDGRHVITYRIRVMKSELTRLQIDPAELFRLLKAQGLREEGEPLERDDAYVWQFVAASTSSSAGHIKTLVLKPPAAPAGIALQDFCSVESRAAINPQIESGARQVISMRRLRECVQRDLSWLLNTSNLAVVQNLERHPFVARSVLNYGMPPLAGRMVTSVDQHVTAQRLREAIVTFEPRLSKVQVIPERAKHPDEMTLSFRIEAELWGQPLPQQLVLRTSIDIDTGDVQVSEAH